MPNTPNPQLNKNGELIHLLSTEGLPREVITHILDTASQFVSVNDREVKKVPLLRGKSVFNLFFENSTRTRTTFEIAADVYTLDIARSSTAKGESLLDTIANLSAMAADIFVVRHGESGAPYLVAQHVAPHVHVVNAGDGRHAHPTQGLLDMYTIRHYKKDFSSLTVAIVGDVLHSRVARSDIHALKTLGAGEVRVVGPRTLAPADFAAMGARVFHDLEEGIRDCDVIIMLRLQNERMSGALLPSSPIGVVLLAARLDIDATLMLSGTVTGAPARLDIVLGGSAGSGGSMAVPAVLVPGGGWSASIDLVDPRAELGTCPVGWSAASRDEPDRRIEGSCLAGEWVDGPAIEVPIAPAPTGSAVVPDGAAFSVDCVRPARRARIITRRDGTVAVAVIPPLTPHERSRRGHRLLIEREANALRAGVFLESFGGRSGGDNPAAICEDLAAHGVTAPLWWSVVDGTVPVPSGARPVVVGSQEWVEALRTSRVIVTNDHLPDWFSKRGGQHLLQTWHGTPIKKLLHDAAPGSVSLRYQRLMARQVRQWDLLLAQNREAEQRLRRALGYGGQVRVGEYPRNVRMIGGSQVRRRVRHELGIGQEQRVILYAPTWRERLRHPEGLAGHSNGQGLLGEVYPAHRTDAVVLMRTHHMNRARPGPGLVDVSRYPNIEELMMAADVLVSDYSSIFLDFALTGKPAVVYVPDLEHYRDVERGLYGDWPRGSGLPVALDHDELTFHLNRILGDFDVQAARREVLEVDPAPVLENLAWIRGWITRFLR